MNFEPTPAQLRWRDRARSFAREEAAPVTREAEATGMFPRELVPRMGELGLLAGPVSASLGAEAMDYVSFALVYEELGYVDCSLRGFVAVHGGLVIQCLAQYGTPAQQEAWVSRLASGEAIGCYALTEANAGSDAAALSTTARRTENGYVLDGEKIWITNGTVADLAIIFARDPELPAEKPHRQICAFLVPTSTDGFASRQMPGRPLGHRGADHAILTLDGVHVAAEAILGAPGRGFHIAMAALDHGRLGVAAGAVGVGKACRDLSVNFAGERRAFGRVIGDFGQIQAALADMDAEVEAAALLVLQAAWIKDRGLPSTKATSRAKLYATEVAMRAADQAVLIHGGRGYDSTADVERHWRDVKGMQIYEGTNHIQRVVIARELLHNDDAAVEAGDI